jgi:hypothetical protein
MTVRTGQLSTVRDALNDCDGNPEAAVELIIRRCAQDKDILTPILRLGARQAVMDFYHKQRASAFTMAAGRAATADPTRLTARIARVAFWDQYTLYGMTPLRDATRDDLEASASQRKIVGRAELAYAAFELAVAAELPDDEATVSEAVAAERVEQLAAENAP